MLYYYIYIGIEYYNLGTYIYKPNIIEVYLRVNTHFACSHHIIIGTYIDDLYKISTNIL